MTFRNHALRTPRYILPDIDTGYQLDPAAGFFSAILPLGADKTNMVINPSIEIDTTGYAADGSVIARDTTVQKYGVASLKITPTANVFGSVVYPIFLVAGTQYYGSVWFKGQPGLKYKISFATTGLATLGQVADFIATGFWQRVSCAYSETASNTRYIYITKNNQANLKPFWIDGLQVEQDQLTTYIDGDQRGFVRNRADFYWTGTPHASTSVRIGQSRAGGKLVKLSDLGFRLLSIDGLGLGGIVHQMTPLSRGGAYYGGTVIADRQFTLVGQIDSLGALQGLARTRQAFIDLLKPDVVTPDQPMVLRYQPSDDCGLPLGPEQDIVCVSEGDPLVMRMDNLNSERLGLTFRLYLPFVTQEVGNVGATLGYQGTFTAAYNAARIAGQWTQLGTGFNNTVYASVYDKNRNRVYFAGLFTTANGVIVNRICYWDFTLQTFVAMDGGVNGTASSLALAPNGDLLIGGSFTTVGTALTATKGLARWNVAAGTWTAFNIATAAFASINAILIDTSGVIYIAGSFTDWQAVAASDYIAKSSDNGVTWVALGVSPFTATSYPTGWQCLALDSLGNLLVGESTSTATTVSLRKWNGTTWTIIATTDAATGNSIYGLLYRPDGALLIAGVFITLGGISAANVALYNGSAIMPLGSGVNALAYTLATISAGTLFGGGFTAAGNISLADRAALYNNSSWSPLDIDLPGSPIVYAVATNRDDMYLGFSTTGTATVATLTTITNTGSASTGPRITFTGPGTVVQLKNYTTGKVIYFNLTLNAGETAVLDLTDPSNITFVSTFRGNILSAILAGSQQADFALAPGANIISLLIDGTTSAATAVNIQYRITSHSLDAAIPGRLLP